MPDPSDIGGAIAFFEQCSDITLLREQLKAIRPRAATAVSRLERRGKEPPPPAPIKASAEPMSKERAIALLRSVDDFAQLQALSRAIGRRLEELIAST